MSDVCYTSLHSNPGREQINAMLENIKNLHMRLFVLFLRDAVLINASRKHIAYIRRDTLSEHVPLFGVVCSPKLDPGSE